MGAIGVRGYSEAKHLSQPDAAAMAQKRYIF